ncbi:HD domain-containing protein [archaeon]|jgi:predicted metal-dependent HD superfamily phosphohydrolase|nr:HD domain-containing protein [archaeon]
MTDRDKNFKDFKNWVKSIYDLRGDDAGLSYHLWSHTDQVLEAGRDICIGEEVSRNDRYLLKTAIVAHDVGNVISRKGHEDLSINFARTNLPYFGYDENQINVVSGLIKATEFPQEPKTHLEKIMCDADLSLMGLDSLIENIDEYRKELGISDLKNWYESQIGFLSNYKWVTETAKMLYDFGKKSNISLYKKKLERL